MSAPYICGQCGGRIEAGRSAIALYCGTCVAKRKGAMKRERSHYQLLANAYVTAAIRHGDLSPLDGSVLCVDCGKPASEYDHRDYTRPLDVVPVCRHCNQLRGPGANKGPAPEPKPEAA